MKKVGKITQFLEMKYMNNAMVAAALRYYLSRLTDMIFPKVGEITHIKDPNIFENILLKRIVSEENFGQINTLTVVDVVKFIKEFKIKKENNRDSVYVASIDVNFNKEKIDKYLKINNLKVSNIISERFLILAVHKRLNNLYLWEKSNNWNKALKNEYDKENLLNLFFPSQNYLNKFKISPKETLSENQEKLSNILKFFNKRSGLIIYLDETYNTKNENTKAQKGREGAHMRHESVVSTCYM